jgi:hypothetical protein
LVQNKACHWQQEWKDADSDKVFFCSHFLAALVYFFIPM